MADGKPYRIKLLLILNISVQSFGVLDHKSNIKKKSSRLIIPRSSKAEYIHRICSLIKILVLLVSILFLPLGSIFWSFIAGLIFSGVITYIVLKINKVKAKTSFLFTPALLIKASVWLIAILAISTIGPGFEISISSYKYLMFLGLFFLTDMLFDLLLGFFPFYKKLFRPIIKQGKVLSRLYKDGYQNYIEYPFYSILYPLYKWIF